MNNKESKKIPKNEDEYKVKYVFKEDSNLDINEVLKKCFMSEINNISNANHSIKII